MILKNIFNDFWMILKAYLGFRDRRPQFHWSKDAGTCMRVMLQEEREMMSEP